MYIFDRLFAESGRNAMNTGYLDVLSLWSSPHLQKVVYPITSVKYELAVFAFTKPGDLAELPFQTPKTRPYRKMVVVKRFLIGCLAEDPTFCLLN